ncbi:MAG: hypothetical protein CMF39_02850 [Legionellaceae bacterium]|nr:hypothetical protein [Legionellaceae bacterium]
MTTYAVVDQGEFNVEDRSPKFRLDDDAKRRLPLFPGLSELHQAVFGLPALEANHAPEMFDLNAATTLTVNGEQVVWNEDVKGNQSGAAAQQVVAKLGTDNPLALLILHDVVHQKHMTFSGTECLRASDEREQVNYHFTIDDIVINADVEGATMTVRSSSKQVTSLTDFSEDGRSFKPLLTAKPGESLCEVETVYRFTDASGPGLDPDKRFGVTQENGAICFARVDVEAQNVTVHYDGLYQHNSVLRQYRAIAHPTPGVLSGCCACLCAPPKIPEGFVKPEAGSNTDLCSVQPINT